MGGSETVGRRRFARWLFFGGLGAMAAGGTAAFVGFLRPGTPADEMVLVDAGAIPGPGADPYVDPQRRFFLVNLLPGEGFAEGEDGAAPGGLLALRNYCTHLGCTVDWESDFDAGAYRGERGAMYCHCHFSLFTRAGVRLFGPASRSMDTLTIDIRRSGAVAVNLDGVKTGSDDNPLRAVETAR